MDTTEVKLIKSLKEIKEEIKNEIRDEKIDLIIELYELRKLYNIYSNEQNFLNMFTCVDYDKPKSKYEYLSISNYKKENNDYKLLSKDHTIIRFCGTIEELDNRIKKLKNDIDWK